MHPIIFFIFEETLNLIEKSDFASRCTKSYRVKAGKFGHQVDSDTLLQTVKIQMRRLLMSRLIRIFTVCLDNLFFIPIFEI